MIIHISFQNCTTLKIQKKSILFRLSNLSVLYLTLVLVLTNKCFYRRTKIAFMSSNLREHKKVIPLKPHFRHKSMLCKKAICHVTQILQKIVLVWKDKRKREVKEIITYYGISIFLFRPYKPLFPLNLFHNKRQFHK